MPFAPAVRKRHVDADEDRLEAPLDIAVDFVRARPEDAPPGDRLSAKPVSTRSIAS
jgi:hypothetical protein